jgi:hypothetical protein
MLRKLSMSKGAHGLGLETLHAMLIKLSMTKGVLDLV